MSRYALRILLWSWGLRVDLGLSVHLVGRSPSGAIPVAPRVWLVVTPAAQASQDDISDLIRGLRRVIAGFRAAYKNDADDLVFELEHLWYPLTDFQQDAIELAVAGWAAEELNLAGEPAEVSFDRAANKYVIDFNEELWKTGS